MKPQPPTFLHVGHPETTRELIRDLVREKLKRRAKLPRAPRMLHPTSVTREYTRELLALVAILRELTKTRILPRLEEWFDAANRHHPTTRRDSADWTDDVSTTIKGVRLAYLERVPPEEMRRIARRNGIRTAEWNKKELNKVTRRVLGIDLFSREPWLVPKMQGFVKENVDQIAGIADEYLSRVEKKIMRGMQAGTPWRDLGEQLEGMLDSGAGNPTRKAQLIARDQIGKFNGKLTELRQKEVGGEKYRWRNSMDERVAGNPGGLYPNVDPDSTEHGDHWDREGKVYSWDEPPPDGNPGEPLLCRCYAEVVFPGEDDED